MHRLICVVLLALLFVVPAFAEEETGFNIKLKQGILMNWDDDYSLDNISTFELARTKPVEEWGKYNVLWDGWTLDAGFAYDAAEMKTVALLLGREFGTVGDYLPIDFPMADLISITAYPIGVSVTNLFDHPDFEVCSGGAFIKLSIALD